MYGMNIVCTYTTICKTICERDSYYILLLMIQLSLYSMMFYVNYTNLEIMLNTHFDSSN